jgi:transcriptional regulator with XRE-family HTH domain
MEKNIGLNIRKLRELRNYTQSYLAEQLGISQRAYSSIESNTSNLSFGRLSLIADILNINMDDIVNFNTEKFLQGEYGSSKTEKEILTKYAELNDELIKTQQELIETQRKLIDALGKKK